MIMFKTRIVGMLSINSLHCFILTSYSGIMSAHQVDSSSPCAIRQLGGAVQEHMLRATKRHILCYWYPMKKCHRNFGGSKKYYSQLMLEEQIVLSFVSEKWMSMMSLFHYYFFVPTSITVLSGSIQLKMPLLNLMKQKCFHYSNYSLNSSVDGQNKMKLSPSHLTMLRLHWMSSVGHC